MLILIRLITNKIEICLLTSFCCFGIRDLIWDLEFEDSRFWCEIRLKIWDFAWRFAHHCCAVQQSTGQHRQYTSNTLYLYCVTNAVYSDAGMTESTACRMLLWIFWNCSFVQSVTDAYSSNARLLQHSCRCDKKHIHVIVAKNNNWRAPWNEYIDIFLFSTHHSIAFCFRCSVYWWKGSVRF